MPDREKDLKDHTLSRPLRHYLGPRLYINTFHRFLPESYRGSRGSRVLCLKCKAVFTFPLRAAQSGHEARAHPRVAKSVVISVGALIVSKRKEELCPVLLWPAGPEHSQEL